MKKTLLAILIIFLSCIALYFFDFTNPTPAPSPTSLTLHVNTTSLKEDTNTTFTLIATDTNDTNKTIQNNIKWKIKNKSLLHVKNNTILAKQEGTTTIQAIYKNKTSNKITINIYKEINGYILPPEPDKKLNNKTILGIDVNNNGIRDDVERFIIIEQAKNPNYPKTNTAISLQYAWAWQKMLENPTLESRKYLEDASDCKWFFYDVHTKGLGFRDYLAWTKKNSSILGAKLEDKLFNTRERIEQRFKFNKASRGHIFDGRKESIENCKTNILELGE